MASGTDRPLVTNVAKSFTVADLQSLPTDVPSGTVDYELDNGRLLTMVPPGDVHGSIQANIVTELKTQGERRGFGKARSEVGIILWRDPDRVVGADAAFIANASLPIVRSAEGYLETKPDLVVEVRRKNDSAPYVQRKVEDYLSVGVKVVWVADPEGRRVTAHSRDAEPVVFTVGDRLTCEFIEGFEVEIEELFNV